MGGLDELIPDDANTSGRSRSSSSRSSSSSNNYVQTFSSKAGEKKFTEEKWNEIRRVISRQMEYSVEEVKNMQSEKRHEVLHEAALATEREDEDVNKEYRSSVTCTVCGNDCSDAYVVIEDVKVHVRHTVGQLAAALDKEIKEQ